MLMGRRVCVVQLRILAKSLSLPARHSMLILGRVGDEIERRVAISRHPYSRFGQLG